MLRAGRRKFPLHTPLRNPSASGQSSLVHVLLDTGRKNQIRVHMASLHHPIMGDKKYGARSNELKRLALHADTFSFIHPFTHQKMTFTTAIPDSFEKVVKKH